MTRDLTARIERHVRHLAADIGERNVYRPEALERAARYIEDTLSELGPTPERMEYEVGDLTVANLEVEISGSGAKDEIVVVGAHYDTVLDSPGANDNGSGVAAVLELARRFSGSSPQRMLRFVFFVNEEPPFFRGPEMGSRRYAERCRQRGEEVTAMLSLETIGYFSNRSGSQRYPFPLSWFYPDVGDFIGVVGNLGSWRLVRRVAAAMAESDVIPVEQGALPGWLPGIGWSDHWAFWKAGYEAVMITDTALFRYPHYHAASDRPEHLDYERCAAVVESVGAAVADLVDTG